MILNDENTFRQMLHYLFIFEINSLCHGWSKGHTAKALYLQLFFEYVCLGLHNKKIQIQKVICLTSGTIHKFT